VINRISGPSKVRLGPIIRAGAVGQSLQRLDWRDSFAEQLSEVEEE